MRYDVFISYSSIDQKIAEGVCAYLEQQGILCFVAYRDIPRGVVWATAIVEALEQSRMMVVLFSKNFNMSKQVEREIELASDSNMPILTFRLCDDEFRGAKKYYLQNLNWIDAFPNPERNFSALHRNVASLLGISTSGNEKKKETPESRGSKSSNLFLWILIGCLSVALVATVVFNDRVSSDSGSIAETIVALWIVIACLSVALIVSFVFNNRASSDSDSKAKTTVAETVKAEMGSKKSSDSDSKTVQDSKVEDIQAKKSEFSKEEVEQFYYNGIGEDTKKNYTEAFYWFKKAAEHGHVDAQCLLGGYYENGKGVSKDLSEAVRWYKKAAEQGDYVSQWYLGLCYHEGKGVSEDLSEAVRWYKKSADQGYKLGQCWLGLCYYYGRGVSKNLTEAVSWFKKAADQGYDYAQYLLGQCYENGDGVSKDITESIKWYQKAADQGDADAKKALERLKNYIQ